MEISIIIVNYKSEELSIKFVLEQLSKIDDEFNIVIVNNSSTDESDLILSTNLNAQIVSLSEFNYSKNNIYILKSKENLGFAKANNFAVSFINKFLHTEYLLFSNNDIEFIDFDIIYRLKNKLRENEKIGIIGLKIIGLDGNSQSPEPFYSFLNRYCWIYLSTPFIPKSIKIKLFKLDYAEKAKEEFHYKVMGSFL